MSHPDCLLVLDTLGTKPSAAILGITALRFDLDEMDLACEAFFVGISADSNSAAHRTYDDETLAWWTDRPDRNTVFLRPGDSLARALSLLTDFYAGAEHLWVSGHGFESAVLAHAYEQLDLQPPWPHWAVYDARTLINITAWLGRAQVPVSLREEDSLQTAYARMRQLRTAYLNLKSRKGAACPTTLQTA